MTDDVREHAGSPRRKRVLLTGATGFVGHRVFPALEAAGHVVTRGSRRPVDAAHRLGGDGWVKFEVGSAAGMEPALRDVDVVLFLVHGMAGGDGYEQRERDAAFALREVAADCGVERIVYLGGVEPRSAPSKHLASRLETGRLLREGRVPTWELRAGMVIGAGSQSWQICRDLAMRLPFMVLPRWSKSLSQPVAIDDVVVALTAAVDAPGDGSRLFDIPGPDVLSAKEILFSIAEERGMRPRSVPVPLLSPKLSSHWLRLVSGADFAIAKELVEGLTGDLVATQPSFFEHIGHRPLSFRAAARLALADDHPSLRATLLEGLVQRLAPSSS